MKIWYFENTHRDGSNAILYDIIYLYILVEKYGQSKLFQNCTFSNGSSIAGRREYLFCQFHKYQHVVMKEHFDTPTLNDNNKSKK